MFGSVPGDCKERYAERTEEKRYRLDAVRVREDGKEVYWGGAEVAGTSCFKKEPKFLPLL